MFEADRTLRESMEDVREPGDFGFAIRNFLDRFYAAPTAAWIEDEPELLSPRLADEGLADAWVAAVAEQLASVNSFPCPPWATRHERVKKTPWFAAKSPNLKAILLQESPAAFRVRNLFVSANALSRA
jgi:hypothetical protein